MEDSLGLDMAPLAPQPAEAALTALWVILGLTGAGILFGFLYCCCAPRAPAQGKSLPNQAVATVKATLVGTISTCMLLCTRYDPISFTEMTCNLCYI